MMAKNSNQQGRGKSSLPAPLCDNFVSYLHSMCVKIRIDYLMREMR